MTSTHANPDRYGPLDGLVVLDLTQVLAGPYGTQLLGDLGAEVIKVEPVDGDMTRTFPPYYHNEDSAYFLSTNRNKRSLAVNLKDAKGQHLVLDLAARCDVVIDSFRPGVMDRLGLGQALLRERNPRLITCSITGFGEYGPYRDRPAFDMIIQALSGGMSLTGEPNGRPVRAGIPVGDLCAGMFAVIGILAATYERDRSGLGQHVEISMLDGQISMLSYQGVYYLMGGDVPGPQGRGHASIPTYHSFEAADGQDVLVCCVTERMWQSLCTVLNLSHLTQDPRFETNETRQEHRKELWPLLKAAFKVKPRDHWLQTLNAVSIPVAPVNRLDEALTDPHVVERRMVVDVEHVLGGTMKLLGNPIKFSRTTAETYRSPPVLGGDTGDILERKVGLSKEEMASLIEQGIVVYRPLAGGGEA